MCLHVGERGDKQEGSREGEKEGERGRRRVHVCLHDYTFHNFLPEFWEKRCGSDGLQYILPHGMKTWMRTA